MHCKGYVITKELPSEEKLNKILEKYNDENEDNKSGFYWDWWQIGGRYGGKIKIHFDPSENEDNWFCNNNRNGKYFISNGLNRIKEEVRWYDELEFMAYMGLIEYVLYVDGGYSKDFIDFDITDCFLIIDDKENLYVRKQWKNHEWIEDKQFDDKVSKIDLKDKFITIIDFHD